HKPSPTVGALPSRSPEPQIVLSGPASATVGASLNVIRTSSEFVPHGVVIVHWRTYTSPAVPENPLAGSLASAMMPPAPLIIVHPPVPETGAFAASVADVPQTS